MSRTQVDPKEVISPDIGRSVPTTNKIAKGGRWNFVGKDFPVGPKTLPEKGSVMLDIYGYFHLATDSDDRQFLHSKAHVFVGKDGKLRAALKDSTQFDGATVKDVKFEIGMAESGDLLINVYSPTLEVIGTAYAEITKVPCTGTPAILP